MSVNSQSLGSELRCAPWTLAQSVDPIGTAGRYDVFVLVEHRLPWPADIAALPVFAEITAGPRVRMQTVVPTSQAIDGSVGLTVWTRSTANRFVGVDYSVDAVDVAATVEAALTDPAAVARHLVGVAPPEVIVCTHGARDMCCGGLGTRLFSDVEGRWPGVRVRRTSHTGGHRFAPTAYSFPDGRGWAFIDAAAFDNIVERSGDVGALRQHQRGSTAVDEFAQPLERAVFESIGWHWLDCEITQTRVDFVDDALQPPRAEVSIEWNQPDGIVGRASCTVSVARTIPVLACGSPPEMATKTCPELAVSNLRIW